MRLHKQKSNLDNKNGATDKLTIQTTDSFVFKRKRLDSGNIERQADMKVSNPHFVGDSKLSRHSFIRHVEAEKSS